MTVSGEIIIVLRVEYEASSIQISKVLKIRSLKNSKKGAPETLDDLIDETDSEEEDEMEKKKTKGRKDKTGIVEDGESFVDFLDKTAPQHFTGKQSLKGKFLKDLNTSFIFFVLQHQNLVRN